MPNAPKLNVKNKQTVCNWSCYITVILVRGNRIDTRKATKAVQGREGEPARKAIKAIQGSEGELSRV